MNQVANGRRDTHASVNRCDHCGTNHAWPFPKTCQRCGSAMPPVRGCDQDKIGAGACPQHPNGCPWET